MLCDKCKKNEAKMHFAMIVNGKKTEIHLCDKCMKETGKIEIYTDENTAVQALLAGIFSPDLLNTLQTMTAKDELLCPVCGMSATEFSTGGRFGCPDCYKVFADQLGEMLKKIHGSSCYRGKAPNRAGICYARKKEIVNLKLLLDSAVKEENYEEAAFLRDQIKLLEKETVSSVSDPTLEVK